MFNVLSLSDSFIQAFQSISRNKRRSLAMISGIVLGVSILSGIIIYTSELQSDNFESIIGNTEYEVSFRLIENIDSEAKLWEIARLLDDPRVESYTVITGPETASLFSQEADLFSIKISSELDFLEEELTQFTPLFIRDNFTDTTIYDQVVQKELEGSFDLGDTSINSTVIPDIVARKFNLKVGDIIEHMNLTIIEDKGSLGHGRLADTSGERAEMMFTNIVVKGIYSSVDDNLFSNFQAAKFYFNTAILEQYGGEVNPLIKSNSNYILAVKLNTDEFSVNDVDTLDLEIDTFINDIGELSIDPSTGDDAVVGNNNIKSKLLPFEFLNLFLVIFDVILVLPMIILCLYLLIFGLTLSLEERRREIGIYKVQGANVNQIFNILRNEAYVLFIMGTIIGYVISIFGAWIIASSTSFMRFDISDTDELWDYVGIDVLALSVSSISIFVIMIIAINKRGKGFINMEVSEAVKRLSVNKANFFVRNDIDLFMVGYGLISSAVMIIDEETVFFDRINFDPTSTLWTIIFRVIGTVFLWMGAAIAGGRLSKWLPQKTEGIFLSLPKLRNIGLIIRSGLKRRGDVNNLVLIIVLTLSITSLAGIQGNSDYNQNLKMLEYEIGADFKVNFAAPSFYRSAIITIPGIDTVMELPFVPATILSQNSLVYGFNPANISEFIWHDDGFDHRGLDEVLDDFATVDAVPEVILGSSIAQSLRAEIDDTFNIKVTIIDPPANTSNIARLKVKVIGIFDHAPGGIDGSSIVATQETVLNLGLLSGGLNSSVTLSEIPSRTYLINAEDDYDTELLYTDLSKLNGYTEIRYLEDEITEIGLTNTFGIPGLLTMMYATSYAAALISAFAFSAILMERRKREFAILQTIGASKSQVSLIALGENALVMLTSVIWGSITGIGLSYLMNGFFNFIGELLSLTTIPRNVIVDWDVLLINALVIYMGMLLATVFSVRSSVRQDLTIATRRE